MVKPDDICRLPCRAADRQQTSKIIGGDLKARDSTGGYQIVSSAMRDRDIARAIVHPPDAFHLRRSEEHTSELQSLMRISYAVFCLKKKNIIIANSTTFTH